MADARLNGVFAPITTPFLVDEELDLKALAANMEFYAQSGIHGYLALGSNGENKSLTADEKFRVLEVVIKGRAKGQTVMTGCIAESTRETVSLAQRAQDMGSDFITLLPPSYFKKQMTDSVLIRYFTEIAGKLSVPCLIYNAPGFAGGLALSQKVISELASHPNICGMKDSSTGNIDSFLGAVPDSFNVLAGSVNNFVQGLMGGATGGVLSLANAFPELTLKLYNLFLEKNYDECFKLNNRVLRLNSLVSGKGGVSSVKAAMDFAGLRGGIPRGPLMPLSAQDTIALHDALRKGLS